VWVAACRGIADEAELVPPERGLHCVCFGRDHLRVVRADLVVCSVFLSVGCRYGIADEAELVPPERGFALRMFWEGPPPRGPR